MCNFCDPNHPIHYTNWDKYFKLSVEFQQQERELMKKYPDMFPQNIKITDTRDIAEIERRKQKCTVQPMLNELYSVNPNFNGIYSDHENR